jgi:hypothetical protein
MNLHRAIAQLHEAETNLAEEFDEVGDRHAADPDVSLICHQLAAQCRRHADQLQPLGERYGAKVRGGDSPGLWDSVMGAVRGVTSQASAGFEETGLVLLRDLRQLYLMVSEVEIDWWAVRQGAMALRDSELAEVFESCHEETWAQVKWVKTKVKEAAPQVLTG